MNVPAVSLRPVSDIPLAHSYKLNSVCNAEPIPHTGVSDCISLKRIRTKINYMGSVAQDMESVNEKKLYIVKE